MLKPNTQYSTKLKTSQGTNFYVRPDFSKIFSGSRQRLEETVELEYRDMLRDSCHREKVTQARLMMRARYSGSPELKRKANEYSTESCQLLEQLPNLGQRQYRDFKTL